MVYFLLIGWWLEPLKLLGRILLWLVAWPFGLWRSIRHGQQKDARKARRQAKRLERRRVPWPPA